jgi:hypothetical protein
MIGIRGKIIMGQYRLWLQHRKVDQNLRKQQTVYEQELSEINEQIAHIENTAMQTNNMLLTALVQQIHMQRQTISKRVDTTEAQPEHNGATHENGHNYQAPPPPHDMPQNTSISPTLLACSPLPNFDTHEIPTSEEQMLPEHAMPILPDATDHLPPNDLHAFSDEELLKEIQRSLPWWLRNMIRTPQEDQEPQKTAPIDQQSIHINQRVEHWLTRRNQLAHNHGWQEGQKK